MKRKRRMENEEADKGRRKEGKRMEEGRRKKEEEEEPSGLQLIDQEGDVKPCSYLLKLKLQSLGMDNMAFGTNVILAMVGIKGLGVILVPNVIQAMVIIRDLGVILAPNVILAMGAFNTLGVI
ncbi:hypothetical protein Hamer_G021661 [Homarus americanus]|uniref:Uncharacterized protein n=1 Tax=Homarus americanus TaxID=6706 RepID=A0A8J5MQP1_HOMAM|nr:hypothetical protein Hamer_G021661 [Homarus americanus]